MLILSRLILIGIKILKYLDFYEYDDETCIVYIYIHIYSIITLILLY